MAERWPEYEAARRATRRQFLLLAGGTCAVMAASGGLVITPILRRGPYPAAPTGLRILGDLEAQILRAVARITLGPDVDTEPIVEDVDATLDGLDPALRRGMMAAFPFLEGGGFVFGGRLRPFTELPRDAQERVLDRWTRSRILVCRQTSSLLQELVVVHYIEGQRS